MTNPTSGAIRAARRAALSVRARRTGTAPSRRRPHPLVADTALALTLMVAALISSHVTIEVNQATRPTYVPPDQLAVISGLAATFLPLALRRRLPLSALVACVAGFVVARALLDNIEASISVLALAVSFYSAAAYGRGRWRTAASGLSLAVLIAELWREVVANAPPIRNLLAYQAFVLLLNLALVLCVWALGAAVRSGRRHSRQLAERTVQLEREREENARRAVFDERVRIARELHDVVAHHVSVMGVQAGAARLVMERDPPKATEALSAIEASSRQAVLELHRLLGFLRQEGDPDDLAPQPGLGQLEDLVAQMADANLTVQLRVDGEPRPLPPTVELSAYRIVQEALTNTLKHGRASNAEVHLRYGPGSVELEILDDGRGGPPAPVATGGHGLIGLRERANLHGGRLAAGPRPEGGFAVRATIPFNGAGP